MTKARNRSLKRLFRQALGLEPRHRIDLECDCEMLGSEYGGHCLCLTGIDSASVVYSFGIGTDVSFDLALIERFGLTVHAFDPTPRSIAWVRDQALPETFHFHEYGLAHFDGVITFNPPQQDEHVSFSTVHSCHGSAECIEAPVQRLSTTMSQLGHERLDVLKLDIEGAEYEVITEVLATTQRPTQVLIEFHHQFKELGRPATDRAVSQLRQAGYQLFSISATGREYSFRYR